MSAISLVVADDQAIVTVVGTATNGPEDVDAAAAHRPDVLLMDLNLLTTFDDDPGGGGQPRLGRGDRHRVQGQGQQADPAGDLATAALSRSRP